MLKMIQPAPPMPSLEELFCHIDDWGSHFEPLWQKSLLEKGGQRRQRARSLCLSEIMTVLVANQTSRHYRNFKDYYLKHVCVYWKEAFPGLVSYNRFVEWMRCVLLPLCVYFKHR